MARSAVLIPLTEGTILGAFEISGRLDLTLQDSLVLASVLQHRDEESEMGVFVTRNSKDFDDPDVRQLLTGRDCELEISFSSAVGRFMGGADQP